MECAEEVEVLGYNLKSPDRNIVNKDVTPTVTNNQIEYMEIDDLESYQNKPTNFTNQLELPAPISLTCDMTLSSEEKLIPLKSREDSTELIVVKQEPVAVQSENSDMNKREHDNSSQSYRDLKNKLRPLVPKMPDPIKVPERKRHWKLNIFIISLVVFLITVLISIYQDQNRKPSIEFVNGVAELKKHIYGQDRAMEALSEYLLLDAPFVKVIALVGGTGVGKSHTVEIIKKNFPRPEYVSQYYSPITNTTREVGFLFLYSKLIILENLKEHDLSGVVNFIKTFPPKIDGVYITVLAVFNFQQMDDNSIRSVDMDRSLEVIKTYFINENIDVQVIPYELLSEDVLKMCIVDAAKDNSLMLSDNQIDHIKQNLLTNNAGCKGAYSKVQLIGRQ